MNIITLEYFNRHNKGGIIEVSQLPTESIDTTSFYRLLEDTAEHEQGVYFYEEDEWVKVGESNIVKVEELPTTPKELTIYELVEDVTDYEKGLYYPVPAEAVGTYNWLRLDNTASSMIYEVPNSIAQDVGMVPQLTADDIKAIVGYVEEGNNVIIKDKYNSYYEVIRADQLNDGEYQVEHQYFDGTSVAWTLDGTSLSVHVVEPLLKDKEYEELETEDKTIIGAINELNKIESFTFKGYVSSTQPTGTIEEGELWYLGSQMPTTFPISVKKYENGSWSTLVEQYTPTSLDLWADIDDDHGYYWFGNKWNLIDVNVEYDDITIDKNLTGQLEVKEYGLELKHLKPQALTEVGKSIVVGDDGYFKLDEIDADAIIDVATFPETPNKKKVYRLTDDTDEYERGIYATIEGEGVGSHKWLRLDNTDGLEHGEVFPAEYEYEKLFVLDKDIDENYPKGLYIHREGEFGKISGKKQFLENINEAFDLIVHGVYDVNFTVNDPVAGSVNYTRMVIGAGDEEGEHLLSFSKAAGVPVMVYDSGSGWLVEQFYKNVDFGSDEQDVGMQFVAFINKATGSDNGKWELLAEVNKESESEDLRHAPYFPEDLKNRQLFVLERDVDEEHPKGLYIYHNDYPDTPNKLSGVYTFKDDNTLMNSLLWLSDDARNMWSVNFTADNGQTFDSIVFNIMRGDTWTDVELEYGNGPTNLTRIVQAYNTLFTPSLTWQADFGKTIDFGETQEVDPILYNFFQTAATKQGVDQPYFELLADTSESESEGLEQGETFPADYEDKKLFVLEKNVSEDKPKGLYIYHKGGGFKGTFQFKDNIDSAMELLDTRSHNISFPVDGKNCYGIVKEADRYISGGFHDVLVYRTDDGYSVDAYIVGQGWTNDSYKTIDLGEEEQEIDTTLANFLMEAGTGSLETGWELLADHSEGGSVDSNTVQALNMMTYKDYLLPDLTLQNVLDAYNSFKEGTPTYIKDYRNIWYTVIAASGDEAGQKSITIDYNGALNIEYIGYEGGGTTYNIYDINNKLDKSTFTNRIYGTDSGANQKMYSFAELSGIKQFDVGTESVEGKAYPSVNSYTFAEIWENYLEGKQSLVYTPTDRKYYTPVFTSETELVLMSEDYEIINYNYNGSSYTVTPKSIQPKLEIFNATDVFRQGGSSTHASCLDIAQLNGVKVYVNGNVATMDCYVNASIKQTGTGWKSLVLWNTNWKYKLNENFIDNAGRIRAIGSMYANSKYANTAFDILENDGVRMYYTSELLNATGGININLTFPVQLR